MTEHNRRDENWEKKSESLDVRLPYSVKQDFMSAARERGETASSAVRRFIDGYIADTAAAGATVTPLKEVTMTVRKNPLKSLAIAAGAAGTMSLVALPSAADDNLFQKLDANGDGVLSVGEFRPGHDQDIVAVLDANKSGDIDVGEFKLNGEGIEIRRDDGASGIVTVRRIVFSLDETGEMLRTSIFEGEIDPDDGDGSATVEERIQTAIAALKDMAPPEE